MIGEPFSFQIAGERVPRIRRIADAEFPDGCRRQRAFAHIGDRFTGGTGCQLIEKEPRGQPVGFQQPFADIRQAVIFALRKLHIVHIGEECDRLRKVEAFDVHDKLDDPAALAAAKAVIQPFFRVDRERRGLFTVKRAEPPKASAAVGQLGIPGDDLRQISARRQLV